MSMYDTKIIRCVECDETMGELDFDAEVMQPRCGQCVRSMHEMRNNLTQRIITNNDKIENSIALSIAEKEIIKV